MKKTLIILIILLLIIFFIIHSIAPYSIIRPYKKKQKNSPASLSLKADKISILTFDSLKLSAYFVYSKQDSIIGNVILLHGIGDSKESFFPLAKFFSNLGYNSLIIDSRAHGTSEGKYCTFGFYEKEDISSAIDFIQEKQGKKANIGIFGNSMGGAIALQAMENDKRISFGIVQSTFSDLQQIVRDYQARLLKISLPIVADYVLTRAGKIASFDPEKVNPSESAKNISQPILMIHGDSDKHISVEYAKQNFSNLKSENKNLFIVKNGNHYNNWQIAGNEIEKEFKVFLESINYN